MGFNVNDVTAWLPIAQTLASIGVQSFAAIKGVMADAGADDATIAALEPKWTELRADVARAAGA